MNATTGEAAAGQALPAVLTRKELGAALKVSGRTICRLVAQRKLPAPFKVGRGSRWKAAEVVSFIEAQGQTPAPPGSVG